MRYPRTRSGLATLVSLTDEELQALPLGDVVIIPTPRGTRPLVVSNVRLGVAFDDSRAAKPFTVPVAEATCPITGRSLVYAAADLYRCAIADVVDDGEEVGDA